MSRSHSQTVVNNLKNIFSDNIVSRTAGEFNVYSIGELNDYETANKFKADVVGAGIADAFVVAYQNGVKISLQKARELSGK